MKRVTSARTFYPKKVLDNNYSSNMYYESMISKRENNKNPNLEFDTPSTFKKNLLKFLKQCKYYIS